LRKIYEYALTIADEISLFGCSIGAYFGMLAYRDRDIRQALFLSPVVDMRRIIENIMKAFGITAEQLELEKVIETPVKKLDWDYYAYTLAHPVAWGKPTALLYGGNDSLCEYETVKSFAEREDANITVMDGGEHWFHTPDQLMFYQRWLQDQLQSEAIRIRF
jgi:pimeloyl-ACP methyl ester carboxylesterase